MASREGSSGGLRPVVPRGTAGLALVLMAGLAACQADQERVVPTAEQVAEGYGEIRSRMAVEMNGNVAELTVTQPWNQIRRGGSLWARVGPYVFLFSGATQEVFRRYSGLAAVRVETRTPGGTRIAEATLRRDALNDLTWRRALNISGKARRDGTSRPSLIEELIRWGEDHAVDFEYNPRYTR